VIQFEGEDFQASDDVTCDRQAEKQENSILFTMCCLISDYATCCKGRANEEEDFRLRLFESSKA